MLAATLLATAARPAAAGHIGCGDTIPAGTRASFDGDVGPCPPGQALVVNAKARVDLNGFTLSCDTGGSGVLLQGEKTHLSNGTISGCTNGVVLADGGKHQVHEVHVTGSSAAAFWVFASDKNKLRSNMSTGSGTGHLVQGDKNLLDGNTSSGDAEGIRLQGFQNKAKRNTVTSPTSTGIGVEGALHQVMANTITDSSGFGIFVFAGSTDHKIVRNLVSGSDTVDLDDDNADCDDNIWRNNTGVAADTCID
jgi:hypothetical protein